MGNEEIKIDKFIDNLDCHYTNIKQLTKFLKIMEDDKCKKRVNKSLQILDKKLNDIINCKNIDELKNHIKLKKLMNGDKHE